MVWSEFHPQRGGRSRLVSGHTGPSPPFVAAWYRRRRREGRGNPVGGAGRSARSRGCRRGGGWGACRSGTAPLRSSGSGSRTRLRGTGTGPVPSPPPPRERSCFPRQIRGSTSPSRPRKKTPSRPFPQRNILGGGHIPDQTVTDRQPSHPFQTSQSPTPRPHSLGGGDGHPLATIPAPNLHQSHPSRPLPPCRCPDRTPRRGSPSRSPAG